MAQVVKTKAAYQDFSMSSVKKFRSDGSGSLTSRLDELKTMFETRLNSLEKKMDLLITTCSSILSNYDDLGKGTGHVCCAALLLPKIMGIDEFVKNALLNGDKSGGGNPVVLVPSGKPPVKDASNGADVISLNSETDLPDGCWLGDKDDPKGRVRVNIPPRMLIHINERCQTPEKMALVLLDYLFPREVQAISNISGKGKHSKCQLDPLKIFAIRCHLVHKFGITEHDWYRIKQNINAKCRAVWRKKINGLPLEANKLHLLRSEHNQTTDGDSDDSQNPCEDLYNIPSKNALADDQQFTLLSDGQTVKVFMDDEFKELLQSTWPDDSTGVGGLSVDVGGCFALSDKQLLPNNSAIAEEVVDKTVDDSNVADRGVLYNSSSSSQSDSDFGNSSDK
ncbi:Hypothetical protein NTJ_12763 [Nesidiocoris tenuis]|uniref:Protein BANP n=1 Tax=Nesidiocoris tenuis TaxID=355587 RepID=A0ABN7B6Q0_9HEMI|nr:Hypothetical protein NTJ_12763 [Nesidiocoris tenuis]